jgi:hypothetical protein
MTIKSFLLLCVVTCALTGCFSVPSLKDPFGAYEAKVTMNERDAQARETIAQYDHDARVAEAENAASAKVDTARMWAGALPNVALIIGACVIVVVYIQWNGRITLARIKRGKFLDSGSVYAVQSPNLEELKTMAARRNQQFKVVNGVALLIDKTTGEIVKHRTL